MLTLRSVRMFMFSSHLACVLSRPFVLASFPLFNLFIVFHIQGGVWGGGTFLLGALVLHACLCESRGGLITRTFNTYISWGGGGNTSKALFSSEGIS